MAELRHKRREPQVAACGFVDLSGSLVWLGDAGDAYVTLHRNIRQPHLTPSPVKGVWAWVHIHLYHPGRNLSSGLQESIQSPAS